MLCLFQPAVEESSLDLIGEDNPELSGDDVLRRFYKIEVSPPMDIPSPIETFESLAERYQMSQQLIDNLKNAGYVQPTPIQMQAIPLMMDKREMICAAPTGSGKTLAFLVPILAQLKEPKVFRIYPVIGQLTYFNPHHAEHWIPSTHSSANARTGEANTSRIPLDRARHGPSNSRHQQSN